VSSTEVRSQITWWNRGPT